MTFHSKFLTGALVALAVGCTGDPETYGQRSFPIEAYCEATVIGTGTVAVETDYLPSVVNCENGAAEFEALKVQAIAARSYLYYKLDTSGSIGDGTGDQVYSCGRTPLSQHFDAVEQTSGIILRYMDTQVAAFYVAGALQDPPECTGGTVDATNTERYVTYNEGKSGDLIDQTTLGFVHPDNHANRGCMSQNGSHCLAQAGRDYESMLRFYYGEDIEIVQTEGPCVTPLTPDAGPMDTPDAGPDNPDDPDASGDGDGDGDGGGGCSTGGSPGAGWIAACLALFAFARRRD